MLFKKQFAINIDVVFGSSDFINNYTKYLIKIGNYVYL